MQSNVRRRVQNTKLAAKNCLSPLIEAVVNSIQAITDRGAKTGTISICLEREPTLIPEDAHPTTRAPVQSITIYDDGVGFTEKNYKSFDELDSENKESIGGRGVGRLLWLKAFSLVKIESVFQENGVWFSRSFEFRLSKEGIENHTLTPLKDSKSSWSKISLIRFFKPFGDACPKTAGAIARKVIECCLEYFLLRSGIKIELIDGEEIYCLNDIFASEFQIKSEKRDFQIDKIKFRMIDSFIRANQDSAHNLHYCAHKRVVTTDSLVHSFPELPATLFVDNTSVVYAGFLSSPFLDENVAAERNEFIIDQAGELPYVYGPTWEKIVSVTTEKIAEFLSDHIQNSRKANVEKIAAFVEEKEPRYRTVLQHKKSDIEKLPNNLSDSQIDLELHKISNKWKQELRLVAHETLERAETLEASEFQKFREEFVVLLGELDDAAKSDLAEYVVHRKTVIAFLEKLLGRGEQGKFAKEEAVHGLFFPMRKTSDDVDYDDHNLWLLDERLSFHKYLASDIPLNQQHLAPIAAEASLRPDIVIYNRRLAFAPGHEPFSSVLIVEFKRPERDDYTDAENPISQVLDYVKDLRAGKIRRDDGSTIEPISEHVPFYCYIVSTITPKLQEFADKYDFTNTFDNLGYFQFHTKTRSYIEIMSLRKVVNDAKSRNQSLFEKLGIPNR